MLDHNTITIVKRTAPLFLNKGLDVTRHMYQLMFAKHPEVKQFFNMANQTADKQPLALAHSLYAYAANIDNLEALQHAISLISHRHTSLGIQPDHYGIVGKNLLQAMQEVLKLDPEALEAWAKAYQFLANVLIQQEKKLYDEAALHEGGWEGYREFILEKKIKESEVITSFYLKPKDGGKIAAFKPGQYLTIKLPLNEQNILTRNYSLSDTFNGEYYRISVKKERCLSDTPSLPDGVVSCYLHDYFEPGMELSVRAPLGSFFLNANTNRPLVLLSAGVGQTPIISMLKTIVKEHPSLKVWFIHCALHGGVHAFREEVRTAAAQNNNIYSYVCYSNPNKKDLEQNSCDRVGYITKDWLQAILPQTDCDYYFCGPAAFMRLINLILNEWDIPTTQRYFEFFGPAKELESTQKELNLALT